MTPIVPKIMGNLHHFNRHAAWLYFLLLLCFKIKVSSITAPCWTAHYSANMACVKKVRGVNAVIITSRMVHPVIRGKYETI